MTKHKAATGQFVNLTSLVDVVSMNVGILVILAVFMALIALFGSASAPGPDGKQRGGEAGGAVGTALTEPPPKLLNVPWSHPTTKQTLFFVMRGNRILFVDFKALYEQMLVAPRAGAGTPVPLAIPGLNARLFPVTSQVYCLSLVPQPRSGEAWPAARQPGSIWHATLARYPKEAFVYFFWVSGDSFEAFRDVRRALAASQVEVGWKPVSNEAPLEVCNGFEGSNTFQPQ